MGCTCKGAGTCVFCRLSANETPVGAPAEMPQERLAEMQALEAKATAGPWEVSPEWVGGTAYYIGPVGGQKHTVVAGCDPLGDKRIATMSEAEVNDANDAEFIAAARTFVRDIIPAHEKALAEIVRLKEEIQCLVCGRDDEELDAARAEVARLTEVCMFGCAPGEGNDNHTCVMASQAVAREVADLCDARAQAEAGRIYAEAALAALRVTVKSLVTAIDKAMPAIQSVCDISALHGFPYRGETFHIELDDVKDTLGLTDTEAP